MNRNYTGIFDDWEIGVAVKKIQEFKGKWKCLERLEEEDLLQECLAHWLFRKDAFNPQAGAKENTFMASVTANKLMDIVREQSSDKRKINHESESLNQPIKDDEDSLTLLDVLDSGEDFRFRLDLKISIEQAFSQLTEVQADLCLHLSKGCSGVELAQKLGIGRATVYREMERIRNIFEKQGLKEFLK